MVNRKTENLSFEAFSVGSEYSRPEIAKPGNVDPLTNTRERTGIVKFQNCIVLFSTLIKGNLPPEHGYADAFSGKQFLWKSQNQNTQNSPVNLRIISLEHL